MKLNPYQLLLLLTAFLLACNNKPQPKEGKLENRFELSNFEPYQPIEIAYKFPAEIEYYLDTCQKSWANQMAGTDYSYLGMEKETGQQFYGQYGQPRPLSDTAIKAFKKDFSPTSAKAYILKRSKAEEIVIINEAHHKPKHRFFTRTLLEDLYQQGYRYLGLETLSNVSFIDTALNQRKYPIKSTGTYSKEPQFGNLIRDALQIGFTLFPYEGTGGGKEREINQARNIANFMKANRGGKYLIHCGYAHATEGEMGGRWEKAMAGRLSEYTGINPLTINQTKFDNRFEFGYLHPLMKRLELKEPTVFLDESQKSYLGEKSDSAFDIMVFHEQSESYNGKPNWLFNKENKSVVLALAAIELSKPIMALAFVEGENPSEAIPYDLNVIEDEQDSIYLALKPGNYNLLLQNQSDSAFLAKLEVN